MALEPHLPIEEVLASMIALVQRCGHRIDRGLIMPGEPGFIIWLPVEGSL
jgi:hypothetical protein